MILVTSLGKSCSSAQECCVDYAWQPAVRDVLTSTGSVWISETAEIKRGHDLKMMVQQFLSVTRRLPN